MSDRLEELEARLDAMSRRLEVVEEQNEWLEGELKDRDEQIERLEGRLDEYERRSDLLDRVAQSSASSRQEKAAVLLQVLHNDASSSSSNSASMDARAGWDNLNRTVDRTTVYDVFEDIVDAVDDEDVCYIKRESRSSKKNTRIVLNLDEGHVPSEMAGVPITEGGD